jgi:hypothetical protein
MWLVLSLRVAVLFNDVLRTDGFWYLTIVISRSCYCDVAFSALISVSVTKVTNLIVISALCLRHTIRSSSVSTVNHGIITLLCISFYMKFAKLMVKLRVNLSISITIH